MKVGEQLGLFSDTEAEPEPAPAAGPAPGTGPSEGPTTVMCLRGRQSDHALLDSELFVYVGRPMYRGGWSLHGHVLANPFSVGRHGTAEQVVARYERWLAEHPRLLARELPTLRGKQLGCWCPDGQPCHARVLAQLADEEAGSDE